VITFLFWNLNQKPLQESVARLARTHRVDVLVLAESGASINTMVSTLNQDADGLYLPPFSKCERIQLYTKYSRRFVKAAFEGAHFSIQHFSLPGREPFLLCSVHFGSKLWKEDLDQLMEAQSLAEKVRSTESRKRHNRTILVGDLNMNPFEAGVASATGLNAAMTRKIAAKQSRTLAGKDYPFFYNPMWGNFGDRTEGPAGTYHYQSSGHLCYSWNMFDQVLLRPSIADGLVEGSLEILTNDGTMELVTETGEPDAKVASDHLPLLFSLEI
jgi:endonuclease/exonuclease/phosphatase (EEP) superfamily protein YafD